MGRHSGFIACYAALANHDVDFVLIPEVPFRLDGFLPACASASSSTGTPSWWSPRAPGRTLPGSDATRRLRQRELADIGACCGTHRRLRSATAALGALRRPRIRDPLRAGNAYDAVYCLRLAQAARTRAWPAARRWSSDAGTAGSSTCRSPGHRSRNQVDPDGDLWMSVLEATAQPKQNESRSRRADGLVKAICQGGADTGLRRPLTSGVPALAAIPSEERPVRSHPCSTSGRCAHPPHPSVGPSPLPARVLGQPPAPCCAVLGLDHHPHQLLGARRAQQHAAGLPQLGRSPR